ncbi:MAG: hypothetical protein ACXWF8_02270 [Methylobacter sp.]
MKAKRKILSLYISALLTAGIAGYPMYSNAASKSDSSSKKEKVEEKKSDSSKSKTENKTQTQATSGTDSDTRGSSSKSDQKITICHVPPGNPANKHTIHIAYSAWAAHKAHTNLKGPDYADYLGSCNSKVTTPLQETIHVISGCTGTTRETLESKVQAYYEPITVADTALDDNESVVTAMSQCLDNGDSSDSGKSNSDSSSSSSGGKGQGHDSVSDSGNHHRIRGCQDKSSGDSSKKYNATLKTADSNYDKAHSTKDPVIVSDSSLDDKDVWKEFKTCVADNTNPNKIDSSKTGKRSGDSGHKQYILKSCGDTQDQKVRDAVTTYKAKSSTKDIIVTASAYNDVTVKAAVDACVSAGAKDTATDSFSPSVAIHGVTITGATIINASVSNNVITGGTLTAGSSPTANVVGGTITGGSVTGGTTNGTTITGATITNATVSNQGVSGRLNFRENTAPVTDTSSSSSTSSTSSSSTTSTTGGTGILAP